MVVGSVQVKDRLQIGNMCIRQHTPFQLKNVSHSPKAYETYILKKLLLNFVTNCPYALSERDNFGNH